MHKNSEVSLHGLCLYFNKTLQCALDQANAVFPRPSKCSVKKSSEQMKMCLCLTEAAFLLPCLYSLHSSEKQAFYHKCLLHGRFLLNLCWPNFAPESAA